VSEPEGKRDARARAVAAARPGVRAWVGFGLGDAAGALWSRLAAALNEEREAGRFFLWLPVAAIGGVLLFFAAGRDPSLWAAAAAFAGLGLIAWASRARSAGFPVAMLLLAVSAGFLSAAVQVERVAAPVLAKPLRGAAVGIVEHVEPRPRGVRLVLAVESLGELAAPDLPGRVRVTVPGLENASAGSRVSVEALWRPPPGPARPGGYDFAREAFFLGIGAVGSRAKAPVLLASSSQPTWSQKLSARIDRLRNAITARIVASVDGDSGAIAAALVTGQRGEISNKANDALRIAGLYHVISISGLHMALFGGTLFAVLRLGLALIPGFGLRHPIKKYAALAALFGAAGYLALSGAEIATQRSFVMIAIVFAAVMFDRQGITMRNLALAAFGAVLLFPEAVLGPSFQMSFCAVMAIVAWYENAGRRAPDEIREAKTGGIARFAWLYFGGITATTIAATLATAPFSTFHFQRFALHSLPSNLIALPIVGLLVMPWALVGMVLMPFGLDGFAWQVMGFGIGLMVQISEWIATWPMATMAVRAFAPSAALLLAFGLIWLSVWTTRLRWLAVAPLAAGIFIAAFPQRPDIYVEPGGRAAAVRGPDGQLHIIGARFAHFAAETWLMADGDTRDVRDAGENVRCDKLGCAAALPDGRVLSLTWTYAGLAEDCARAAIVVTRLVAPPSCRETAYVIDAADLARGGAVALSLNPDNTFAAKSAREDTHRIWHGETFIPEGPAFAKAETKEPARGGFDPTDVDDDDAAPAADDQ
jgi:competence protein ComEC